MSSSRASANAKLLQRHQRRSSFTGAKASANKFTEKQSHFERRREEEHVRMMQQASGNQTLQDGSSSSGAAGRTAADAMVGSRRDAWRGTGGGVQAGSEDAPSPFALHQQRKRSGHVPIGAGSTAMSTVGGSTFGMPTPVSHATRSQRRTSRFNLSERPEGGGAAAGGGGEEATGMSGLLGTAVAPPWESGTDEEQPGQKRTREERFHDIVSNSKMHRAQQQRERAGREEETKALDKEIDSLLHLLTPRDKIKEEHDAFMRSGTPHVRHLLKEIKKKDGYEARQLRVRANGEFSITSLAGTPIASGANESSSSLTRQQKAALIKSNKPADVAEVLDEAGRRLLAKIRKGQKAPEELALADDVPEEDAVDAPGDEESEDSIAPADPEDDFDKMLNVMSLDPRRARATDRTLDEAEEAELAAQQALLEADRSAIPSLGLAEQDRVMLTRSEWMEQGGDRAMHMDAEEEDGNVYDDNVDIPSSYEGDSDGDEREAVGGAETQDEEEGAEVPSSRTPASTSAVLDQLMAELERIARSSVPHAASSSSSSKDSSAAAEVAEAHRQRRQHLHKIITQLHAYASHHVLQVAELFRLVLIEAERTFLRHKRGILNSSLLLHLYVLSKIFPMSDHRHHVTTPFLIFLCSTLMQARLETLHDVHAYLVLSGLLLNSMRSSSSGGQSTGRFCAELVVAPLNVLLLQVPKHIVEPAKYQGLQVPIPLVDRSDAAVLAPLSGTASSSSSNTGASGRRSRASQPGKEEDPTQAVPSTPSANAPCTIDLLQTDNFEAEHLLLAAYYLLSNVVDLYSTMPALPAAVLEPFHFFERLIAEHDTEASDSSAWTWRPTPAVRAAHTALAHKLTEAAIKVEEHRTPLAMRYFRPRPLRLFEPLLAEQEANAVKTEIRTMKRDIREDKKRVMRHLTAEATVQRRAKDRESALDEAQREKRYNQVLGQLQAQQHTMKTVDAMMSKAKSKQRKSISGLPTAPGGGGDDAE